MFYTGSLLETRLHSILNQLIEFH